MFVYSLNEIAEITDSTLLLSTSVTKISSVILDSRTYNGNSQSIFIAIVGAQHNGHKYINDMYLKGCRNFWVQKNEVYTVFNDANYIESNSVIDSYQLLITNYRNKYTNPLIAITGSNGKTSIKEALFNILSKQFEVVRSPRSYNSQIGVPLSIQLINNSTEFAIIEAGISECGEMQRLQKIIQPTIGIFANIGDAHEEGFEDEAQKVSEKMKLFKSVQQLIICADHSEIYKQALLLSHVELHAWSFNNKGNILVSVDSLKNNETYINISSEKINISVTVPFADSFLIENAIHTLIAANLLGVKSEFLSEIKNVPKLSMRLEQKEGKNNCTIINDSYNSDFVSVKHALDVLSTQVQHENKIVILSDIIQAGTHKEERYKELRYVIEKSGVSKFIGVGADVKKYLNSMNVESKFYNSTQDFLDKISISSFNNQTILLKGGRDFMFEKISGKLELQTHQTVLEINLQSMVNNLNYFKSYLHAETKLMVMVKAFSYGSGSYEIANLLQHHKVDYLAVAFIDEGIELRNAGVSLPIVVMNPEIGIMPQLFENNLEPEIHNFDVLKEYALYCNSQTGEYKAHIKIDTGMARYGFSVNNVEKIISEFKSIPNSKIASVFSHLAGSDEQQFDEFTLSQIKLFDECSSKIINAFNYKIIRHILNSAGIERFPEYQFDMVRLGIGLYGISALNSKRTSHLSTLKTFVSHVREIDGGTTVGYSRKGKVTEKSRIAVLPIGYADGYNRLLSNGVGQVVINNQLAPIIGNVCMDACMVDITNVSAEIGDEVILFGAELPITDMASKLNTIPYEVITSISRRVKRVYIYE